MHPHQELMEAPVEPPVYVCDHGGRIGQSNVAGVPGASESSHIRPIYGSDMGFMGLPVSPGVWAGYGDLSWVRSF